MTNTCPLIIDGVPGTPAASLTRFFSRPDGDLFSSLYHRHAAEILRYAIRCTGRREIAEEISADAFLRLLEALPTIEADRAGAWLTTTVRNLATDYWRRQALERRHAETLVPTPAPPPELASRHWLAHPSLKPEHRVCLTLHYFHGMTAREIAGHTALTPNQVKNALQYGLKLLRAALGAAEDPQ